MNMQLAFVVPAAGQGTRLGAGKNKMLIEVGGRPLLAWTLSSLAAAARFGVENTDDVGEMLRREDVDLVYIATPPFLHHSQALAALEAGKHVIVYR